MSFEVKKNFFDEFSIYKPHNQSTVETVTAISNMFFKQKSEIKHMYTMGVVVICAFFLLDVLWPKQHNRGHIEPVSEPTRTVLGQA